MTVPGDCFEKSSHPAPRLGKDQAVAARPRAVTGCGWHRDDSSSCGAAVRDSPLVRSLMRIGLLLTCLPAAPRAPNETSRSIAPDLRGRVPDTTATVRVPVSCRHQGRLLVDQRASSVISFSVASSVRVRGASCPPRQFPLSSTPRTPGPPRSPSPQGPPRSSTAKASSASRTARPPTGWSATPRSTRSSASSTAPTRARMPGCFWTDG